MGRGPNKEPTFNAKLPAVHLFQADLERYQQAAERRRWSLSEFVRFALDEATRCTDYFFYVRLPNGTHHPPKTEPGYEFFDNARRWAARVNGQVVRERIEPADRDQTSGESRLAPGQ